MINLKVLITGGAGFIGSSIANSLIRENSEDKITVLDDLSLGVTSNLSKGIEFIHGSVMDYELLQDLVADCDYIFHDAAKSSSPMFKDDPRNGVEVNTLGFMNVMECARRSGKVRKVIYASSSSIYNGLPMPFSERQIITPKTFYETSFYCREIIARSYYLEYNVPSIGLRYFSVYGPNERHKGKFANNISQFLWDLASNISPVIYGDGSQSRDFTHVDDIVQANFLAMKSEVQFGIYNVGTGVRTSFNEVIRLINNQLGADVQPKYVPNPVKNYVQDTQADISLIRSQLHYKPKLGIKDGIEALVTDFISKKASTAVTPATTGAAS